MTNIWREGVLTTSPYRETAFQILAITRDVVAQAEIRQKVEERRQAVSHLPGFYQIGERPLTMKDVTRAARILADPTRRILEELLEHQPEMVPLTEIEAIAARLQPGDWPQTPPPPRHLNFLRRAIPELMLDYLEAVSPAEAPAFPIGEINFVPPFAYGDEHE